jgi:mannose-6-phosphate isomerase-like protein (cupin superfamily)
MAADFAVGKYPVTNGEVREYEIVQLLRNQTYSYESHAQKEKLFVITGSCRIKHGDILVDLQEGGVFHRSFGVTNHISVQPTEESVIVIIRGAWGEDLGACGVFTLDRSETPENMGDPVSYDRNTHFDNHYHDCDEYWIIAAGFGTVVVDGVTSSVKPGEYIFTPAGTHHDFPMVIEKVHGVYFETSMYGLRRTGHLWNHTHGKADRNDYV